MLPQGALLTGLARGWRKPKGPLLLPEGGSVLPCLLEAVGTATCAQALFPHDPAPSLVSVWERDAASLAVSLLLDAQLEVSALQEGLTPLALNEKEWPGRALVAQRCLRGTVPWLWAGEPCALPDALAWAAARRWKEALDDERRAGLACQWLAACTPPVGAAVGFAVWQELLRPFCAELVALNEKTGKALKARLCEKHFGMNDEALVIALGHVCRWLRLWESHLQRADGSGAEGGESAVPGASACVGASGRCWQELLAFRQAPLPHVALVQEHTTLMMAMHVIAGLGMRASRALTLFPAAVRERFFSPMSIAEPLPPLECGAGVLEQRRAWARRALAASLSHSDHALCYEEAMAPLLERLPCAASGEEHSRFVAARLVLNGLQLGQDEAALHLWEAMTEAEARSLDSEVFGIARRRLHRLLNGPPSAAAAALVARLSPDLVELIGNSATAEAGDCDIAEATEAQTASLLELVCAHVGEAAGSSRIARQCSALLEALRK